MPGLIHSLGTWIEELWRSDITPETFKRITRTRGDKDRDIAQVFLEKQRLRTESIRSCLRTVGARRGVVEDRRKPELEIRRLEDGVTAIEKIVEDRFNLRSVVNGDRRLDVFLSRFRLFRLLVRRWR